MHAEDRGVVSFLCNFSLWQYIFYLSLCLSISPPALHCILASHVIFMMMHCCVSILFLSCHSLTGFLCSWAFRVALPPLPTFSHSFFIFFHCMPNCNRPHLSLIHGRYLPSLKQANISHISYKYIPPPPPNVGGFLILTVLHQSRLSHLLSWMSVLASWKC